MKTATRHSGDNEKMADRRQTRKVLTKFTQSFGNITINQT